MDYRRLSTLDLLNTGILNKPMPETDIPEDRERFEDCEDPDTWGYIGNDAVLAAVEDGKVVSAPNYYGIPYLWKDDDGRYQCRLLQYRNVTEAYEFKFAENAVHWFKEVYHRTDG